MPQAAVADPDSVFHHYRRLIELRHRDPVVVDGRFELLLPDDPQVWAFTRTLDDVVLVVLANCSSAPARIEPGDGARTSPAREVLLPTHGASYDLTLSPGSHASTASERCRRAPAQSPDGSSA